MLTVWCVCVGDKYSDEDVWTLARMVKANIDQPYIFKCLSDRVIPGVNTVISRHNWPGWWSKLELFEVAKEGRHLYFDLDVVITGSVDALVSDKLSMPKNWAQSGHGGCQSSVMSWSKDYSFIAQSFGPQYLEAPTQGNHGLYGPLKLWGDQEFITNLLGSPGEWRQITPRPWRTWLCSIVEMDGIYSYKYHCRGGLPDSAKVVCFHGLPKPNQVNDQWVVDARSRSRQSVA